MLYRASNLFKFPYLEQSEDHDDRLLGLVLHLRDVYVLVFSLSEVRTGAVVLSEVYCYLAQSSMARPRLVVSWPCTRERMWVKNSG